jgi:hypothetical protein
MSSTPTSTDTKNKKNSIPKVLKDLCWKKWIGESVAKNKCMCCEMNEVTMNNFQCGHVLSEANGGKLSVENLRPICVGCNLSMGTENMASFKERCGFGSAETLGITVPKEEKTEKSETLKASTEPNTPEKSEILKTPKVKKEKSSTEIVESEKKEVVTSKEKNEKSEKNEVLKPKEAKIPKKKTLEPQQLYIDENRSGLKQEHYKLSNEECKGFLFKSNKVKNAEIGICIGKLSMQLFETIPENYEYNLEELSEKDIEILNKFERTYTFEGKKEEKKEEDPVKIEDVKVKKQKESKETNEVLVWEEGLLKKKLPKYLEAPQPIASIELFEKMKAEMEGVYRFLAENVYKRIK